MLIDSEGDTMTQARGNKSTKSLSNVSGVISRFFGRFKA
jgi:hypothetical protein